MTRPSTSVGPPAANGMTMVSWRVGKFCAPADPVSASTLANAAVMIAFFNECSSTLGGGPSRSWRRRSRLPIGWLAHLDDLFRELVQPVARAIPADQIIVAQ